MEQQLRWMGDRPFQQNYKVNAYLGLIKVVFPYTQKLFKYEKRKPVNSQYFASYF